MRVSIGMAARNARINRRQERKLRDAAWAKAKDDYKRAYGVGFLAWLSIGFYVWKIFLAVWNALSEEADQTLDS